MKDEEGGERSQSLGRRAATGAAWTILAQVVVNILRLGGNLVSASFLDTDAYGLMAIVVTVNVGLIMVSDVGIEQSVIYSDRGSEKTFLHTAFTLQVARGVLLWLSALVLTYPVVLFYDEPRFAALLPIASLQTFFAGFNSIRFAWNKRKVRRMKELALIEIATQAAAFCLIVGLSWALRSVWALAIGATAYAFARMVLTHVLLDGPSDGFAFDRESAKSILTYGRWILVSTVITFLGLRFDILALGKLAGLQTLGLYNMALILGGTLNAIGIQVAQSVIFPALSEARRTGDPTTLRRTFEKAQRVVLPIGVWAVTGFVYLGPPFFHFAYRDQFADAGWMLQLQMIFIWFVFLTDAWARGLLAVNDNRNMALANAIRLASAIVFVPLGHVFWGVPGFILGMGLASLLALLWMHRALLKHGLSAWKLDLIYSLRALPLVLLGAFGPQHIARVTGIDAMLVALVFSVLVGVPFTAWLVVFLKRNIRQARRPAVGTTPEPDSLIRSGEMSVASD